MTTSQFAARRLKVLRVAPSVILGLLRAPRLMPQNDGTSFISTYDFKDKDVEAAVIHHVYYDNRSQSFNFVLEHPDWDEVQPGEEIPAIIPEIETATYKVHNNA